MALEQALARLDHALAELAGNREKLAAAFDRAITATLTCVEALDLALTGPTPASAQAPIATLKSAA